MNISEPSVQLTHEQLFQWMQWSSPSLPIGGFSWSRGLESAVQNEWVISEEAFSQWLSDQLLTAMAETDLPLLIRLHQAWSEENPDTIQKWNDISHACRESMQLRMEESLTASAIKRLMGSMGMISHLELPDNPSSLCLLALRAALLKLPAEALLSGVLWTWMDAQIAAAIKLIPLGQTAGQRVFAQCLPDALEAIQIAQTLSDDEIGNSPPGQVLSAMLHETCYSRLFRS